MENNASNGASALAVLLTVLSLVFGFLAALRRWRNTADPVLPPGLRGLPLVGYLIPFLRQHLHREFAKLAEIYGPIYKLWLGNKLWVVISSPSLAKEISRDQDVVFANRDATIAASAVTFGGKDIAFADYGPYWRKMRKIFVREMMSSSSLDACYSLRKEEVKKCINNLHSNAGSPVDLGQLSLFLLINSIMAMLWGHTGEGDKRESLNLEFQQTVAEMMVLLGKANISDIFPALARFDAQGVERKAKSCHRRIDSFLDSIIDRAIEGAAIEKQAGHGERKKDILQLFLDLDIDGDEDNRTSTTKNREIKAILTDILVGGTDTTSTMVEWVMSELLQHKAVSEKVMEELTEVVGMNNMVEEHDLPKLTYLDAVIKETFRLHPPLPLLVPRCPSQSATIGGSKLEDSISIIVGIMSQRSCTFIYLFKCLS
ncbi:hypothetical protein CDL15_Pgr017738 [Punica granatum]|uniref:Uncharacterized protein n=1 Tax=Punica granatum TaxID=22663 RepID=A0A218WG97_PUNGR|nr:hypothetical protein CDL15_Pgr017738 [Punica granatum]